jgi:hypothetical protein
MLQPVQRTLTNTLVLSVALLAGDALADYLQAEIHGQTAIARASSMTTASGKPERLDFDFGEVKVWLRENGNWHIEGPVPHQGLLCATRTLSVRFGIGNPGCTKVHWLSEFDDGSSVKQCNNATAWHNGGGFLSALQPDYTRITCAERAIQCSGNCK